MNKKQADEILGSMVAFIKQHGIEEVQRIEKAAGDEFTIQKNQYVDEQKKNISETFKNELANEEVRLKIEKSKEQNKARIDRMRKVNEYVETLRTNMKKQVREKLDNDPAAYKTLLKDLLIQVSFLYNLFILCGFFLYTGFD
jgi:vacuolar-type H+-ATPase subunit E/Vma4